MTTKRLLLLALGTTVVALSFLFPQTQHPTKSETRKNGQLVGVSHGTKIAFAMPIWKALSAQKQNMGNPTTDTTIMWFQTAVRGFAIAVFFGVVCYYLGATSNGEMTEPLKGARSDREQAGG